MGSSRVSSYLVDSVQTSVSVEVQRHGDEDDSEGDAVSDEDVLTLAQKAVLLHDVRDLCVDVEALEEHEHECCGEEEVDEDGDDAARPRVVVEGGQQQADVRQDQAHLHVQLDHSGTIKIEVS